MRRELPVPADYELRAKWQAVGEALRRGDTRTALALLRRITDVKPEPREARP